MRTKIFTYLMLAAGLTGAGCESQRNTATVETAPTSEQVAISEAAANNAENASEAIELTDRAPLTDAEFVARAAQNGMAEVKLGNLAERMAVSTDVKKFGVQMAMEHKRVNALLMEMARKKKWLTPAEMDAKHDSVYNKMLTVMSDQFDKVYMTQIVEDQKKAVSLYENAAANVQDPELKEFISNTLPSLRRHLEMAKEVYTKAIAKG